MNEIITFLFIRKNIFLYSDGRAGPVRAKLVQSCVVFFIEQSKTFTIPVEIKTGKLFLQTQNINYMDPKKKKTVRLLQTALLSWYAKRREK